MMHSTMLGKDRSVHNHCTLIPCVNDALSLMQLAGILKPYRGECLLDPPPSDAGPAGLLSSPGGETW